MTLWESPNRLPARHIQLDIGLRYHGVAARKFTKSWQDGASRLDDKARQPQAVARWALQLYGGMQMTCKHGVGGVFLRMMTGGKRADKTGLFNHADVQLCGWVACPTVVVAAYQYALELRMALPPNRHLTKH